MKYYTRDWMKLVKISDFSCHLEPVEDKVYTEYDIKDLYDKKVMQFLFEAEIDYNEAPQLPTDELLENFDLADWSYEDLDGNLVTFNSKEEVIEMINQQKQMLLDSYNNRPEFSEEFFRQEFDEMYLGSLNTILESKLYPDYIMANVPARLLALGYIPQKYYDMLKQDSVECGKKLSELNREASNKLKLENVSDDLKENFYFHNCVFQSLENKDNDLVLHLLSETGDITVNFKNGIVIENEGINDGDIYMFEELYDSGKEIHMSFMGTTYKYLTIRCDCVKIKVA